MQHTNTPRSMSPNPTDHPGEVYIRTTFTAEQVLERLDLVVKLEKLADGWGLAIWFEDQRPIRVPEPEMEVVQEAFLGRGDKVSQVAKHAWVSAHAIKRITVSNPFAPNARVTIALSNITPEYSYDSEICLSKRYADAMLAHARTAHYVLTDSKR